MDTQWMIAMKEGDEPFEQLAILETWQEAAGALLAWFKEDLELSEWDSEREFYTKAIQDLENAPEVGIIFFVPATPVESAIELHLTEIATG